MNAVRDFAERARQADSAEAGLPTLVTVRAVDVKPEPIRWLWAGRIPLGKLTILEGPPGLGKTSLAIDLAARVSSGRGMPLRDGDCADPRAVIMVSYEDDLNDTIRPRLEAAGADLALVHLVKYVAQPETDGTVSERELTFPGDVGSLALKVGEHKAALVVVDPLMAALAGKIDSHKDQDVRRVLSQLRRVAEATGVAIVLIRHLRKATGPQAIYAGQGSIGIIGAARAAHIVSTSPDGVDPDRRIFAPVKLNLARMPKALEFKIVESSGVPVLQWLGECDETADMLVALPPDEDDRGELETAIDFLTEVLSNGPRPAKEVEREAKDAGLKWRTVQRARERLAKTRRGDGGWIWEMKAARGKAA